MFDQAGPLDSLIRRAPLVGLCALLAAGAALGWSLLQDKRYTATADLLAASARVEGTPSWLVTQNNVELAGASAVIRQAVDDLGGGLSYNQASDDLVVDGDAQSGRISVTATADDPRVAADLANGVVRNAIQRLEGDPELLARAQVPDSPSSPRTARNTAAGAALGLMLGAVLALLLPRSDRRVRSVEELEEFGPVIGAVPTSGALARLTEGKDSRKGSVVQRLPFREAEAFRMIATRLRYLNSDRRVHTVVVTSSLPVEGKTTVAANLAKAEASAGSRVCLVEADLRKPDFASATGLRELPGLAEVLTGQSALDDAVQQLAEPNEAPVGRHIDVIVAGTTPANPVELTESREMQELATQIGARYDLVVVDAPPPTLLADAIPLLKLADGVLVVAQVNRVTPEALGRLRDELQSLDVRVLGIVANRAATGREARDGEHYRNYQGPAGARLGGLSRAESGQGTPGPQEPPTASPVAREEGSAGRS